MNTGLKIEEQYMRKAIGKARTGVLNGQSPFGACIVRDGSVLSCEHNSVWMKTDITAHAEINAIRSACRKSGSIDLSGSVIYSTCEPCPMCFSACHWAGISVIIYGARIKDARSAGFSELTVSNQRMKALGGSPVKIVKGFLKEENAELFNFWKNRKNKKVY